MAMFPKIIGTLEQSMRAATLRHQVLANNIANVNVPGYQASELSFEERLKQALQEPAQPQGLQGITTHERHIPIGEPRPTAGPVEPVIQSAADGVMRQDGNNVDLEAEMAKLAANQLWYQALVRSVTDEFGRLRTVIMEGRR